jgi:hypothetical protein
LPSWSGISLLTSASLDQPSIFFLERKCRLVQQLEAGVLGTAHYEKMEGKPQKRGKTKNSFPPSPNASTPQFQDANPRRTRLRRPLPSSDEPGGDGGPTRRHRCSPLPRRPHRAPRPQSGQFSSPLFRRILFEGFATTVFLKICLFLS